MRRVGSTADLGKLKQQVPKLTEKPDLYAVRGEPLFRWLVKLRKTPRLVAQRSVIRQKFQTLLLAESLCQLRFYSLAQLKNGHRPVGTWLVLNEKNLPRPLIQAFLGRRAELLQRDPDSGKELLDLLSPPLTSLCCLVH